jgi:hypothetical protein
MTQRYKIGDKVIVKDDQNVYTLTGYVSDFGYSAQYTAIYQGKPIVMETSWLPDALIVEKLPNN